jgi:hypothetical protein
MSSCPALALDGPASGGRLPGIGSIGSRNFGIGIWVPPAPHALRCLCRRQRAQTHRSRPGAVCSMHVGDAAKPWCRAWCRVRMAGRRANRVWPRAISLTIGQCAYLARLSAATGANAAVGHALKRVKLRSGFQRERLSWPMHAAYASKPSQIAARMPADKLLKEQIPHSQNAITRCHRVNSPASCHLSCILRDHSQFAMFSRFPSQPTKG